MVREDHEPTERTALLAGDGEPVDTTIAATSEDKVSRRAIVTFSMSAATIFFFTIYGALLTIPEHVLAEEMLCRKYHPDIESGKDPRCKDDDVQNELSFINGWSITLILLPGVLTAVPYGLLADAYGRRLGLALAVLGVLLQQISTLVILAFPHIFSLRMVWFTALFNLIGGGPTVLIANIFATLSNVAPGSHKTLLFSYLGAIATGTQLISGPLAFFLVQHGIWLSVYIGVLFLLLSCICCVFIPHYPSEVNKTAVPRTPNTKGASILSLKFYKEHLWATGAKVRHVVRTQFIEHRTLGLLLTSLVFTTLGKAFSILMDQYVTRRYHWTWAQAGLIPTLQGAITVATTAVILPAFDHLLRTKWSWTLFDKDIWLLQASLFISIFSYCGIGIAPSSSVLIMFLSTSAFGRGYEFIMRSLLAQVAGEANAGVVMTTMSMLETTGIVVAGPLLAAAFRQGLKLGGVFLGFPFFVATALLILGACFVVAAARTSKVDLKQDRDE